MDQTLVVLAAGLSSRYGTLKQLEPLGPGGEVLLDYAVYDAARAGVSRVVCVVRPEIERRLREHVARGLCDVLPVEFVIQRIEEGRARAGRVASRVKPWGTGHAILTAAKHIAGPFISVNADDFYGAHSYVMLSEHLASTGGSSIPVLALVGFPLRDTLSEHGGVSRGICRSDDAGFLEELIEVTQIVAAGGGISGTTKSVTTLELRGDEMASMNIWAVPASTATLLHREFNRFLRDADQNVDEFLMSSAVNAMLDRGTARLRMLPARDEWFGITHPGDRRHVMERLRALTVQGVYPEPLYPRKDR